MKYRVKSQTKVIRYWSPRAWRWIVASVLAAGIVAPSAMNRVAGAQAPTMKQVYSFGDRKTYGAPLSEHAPLVGAASTPSGKGYWVVGSDGGVFTFGHAKFYGSLGSMVTDKPVKTIVSTPTGKGYWLVDGDGGVYSFGDAKFYGSLNQSRLPQPVVDMVVTKSGRGYWLVAGNGDVFPFGDAKSYGSAKGFGVNIVAAVRSLSGKGYVLVSDLGRAYAFGDGRFAGSSNIAPGSSPVVDAVSTPTGRGYWMVTKSGALLSFGDAKFFGSAGGNAGFSVYGLLASASGKGYMMLADGGVLNATVEKPAVKVAATPAAATAPAPPVPSVAAGVVPNGKLLGTFSSTCYALSGHTASGLPVSENVIAVDPRVIPLGTRVYIDGLGYRIAADTGGAIKGRIVDIWKPSVAACMQWGRRPVTVRLA